MGGGDGRGNRSYYSNTITIVFRTKAIAKGVNARGFKITVVPN